MNKLQEKRSLAELARKFGQEPAADLLAEIQQLESEQALAEQRANKIRSNIATDLQEIFSSLPPADYVQPVQAPSPAAALHELKQLFAGVKHKLVPTQTIAEVIPHEPEPQPSITESVNTSVATVATHAAAEPTIAQRVAQAISESGVVAPDPVLAQPQKDLEREIKYLREWVSRIAATGPGGGAAQVYNLDMPTKLVTTSSYTIGRKDYYIGVNYAGRSFITLPTQNLGSGRDVIIKDESGRCQAFPITVIGNVDNDPDGFRLEINNGAIHLIYRDGWRIV